MCTIIQHLPFLYIGVSWEGETGHFPHAILIPMWPNRGCIECRRFKQTKNTKSMCTITKLNVHFVIQKKAWSIINRIVLLQKVCVHLQKCLYDYKNCVHYLKSNCMVTTTACTFTKIVFTFMPPVGPLKMLIIPGWKWA